jgi:hypothetical protein
MRATAPARTPPEEQQNPWQRASLVEGVAREPVLPAPWQL